MADLKCSVENCNYNKEHLCSKGDIMVGGRTACDCKQTCCESFSCTRGERETFRNSLEHASHTISIDCEAVGCLHNVNYKCIASHVNINGKGANNCQQTTCDTFVARK